LPKKISPFKVSKIISYYLEGYSQPEIASKLNIDQSTVSKQISKFKAYAEQYGINAAIEEYGVMDIFDALHDLAVDLQANHLTVEEAAVGLKMVMQFEKLGIKEKDYQDVIQAATKMKTEGFISSAVELNKLEQSTGMTHKEIVDKAVKTNQQLEQKQVQLNEVTGKLNACEQDLTAIESKKKKASQDLEVHLQQVGMDMERLAKVEKLASALKKAGVSDDNLQEYIKRQHQLNEAGISLDVFASILKKAAVVTSKDSGQALLEMLTEHGSLSEANIVLKTEIGSLEKEAVGLEEKVKLKGEIEAEIAALKAEKTSLEPYVSELHAKKDQLEKVQNYVDSLTKKRAELEKDTASMEKYKTALDKDIRVKEKKVSNLEKLEKRHDAVSASLAETKKKLDWEERRLKVLDSIQGVVKSSSVAQLEKFAENLPYYIEEVKGGHYSGEIIRNILVENLTGGTLQVLRCSSCEAKFVVDKQPSLPGSDYYCPVCGMSYYVNVDKNALAILKEELLELKKPNVVFIERISPGSQEQKNLDKADK
jgi:predicted DNA-binding protein YlxM (UPF0122 family)/DNA repair exonuclease SbcCD ATPase subunit